MRDRLEKSFSDSNEAFLEEIRTDSEKRFLQDNALLDWDKQKEQNHMEMYKVELAIRERIGNRVADALGELAKSFTNFTSKLAKNKK
jgi:hypothetical protein